MMTDAEKEAANKKAKEDQAKMAVDANKKV